MTQVQAAVLLAGWALASLAVSWWVVGVSIAYAHRRGMLDLPGQRRSHHVPTPRGGGIGIVLASILAMPAALWTLPGSPSGLSVAALPLSTLMVALVGWLDDHRPLGVVPRLSVQLLASMLFGVAMLAGGTNGWWLPVLVLAGTWSINLHNFMDGIDGLLGQQLAFVAVGLGVLAWSSGQVALAGAAFALAAAAVGFLRYNWPPARIFMGDVGSGTAGFLLFTLAALISRQDLSKLWVSLILASGFAADASLTLFSRFVRGRRWYSPHREHLYQWLVRSGWSHGQCTGAYLAWNLLVAAPAAFLAVECPGFAFAVCLVAYTIAVATWTVTKRRCLRRDLHEASHGCT